MDDPLRERLAELDKPIVFEVPLNPIKPRTPEREPLIANNPRELVNVLIAWDSPAEEIQAAMLAFAARCPGQAKKMPKEWLDELNMAGALPPLDQWAVAIRVGELIAVHKYVKTPMAPEKGKK